MVKIIYKAFSPKPYELFHTKITLDSETLILMYTKYSSWILERHTFCSQTLLTKRDFSAEECVIDHLQLIHF